MKLRLNATLRAALIAAITAVMGCTLPNAMAQSATELTSALATAIKDQGYVKDDNFTLTFKLDSVGGNTQAILQLADDYFLNEQVAQYIGTGATSTNVPGWMSLKSSKDSTNFYEEEGKAVGWFSYKADGTTRGPLTLAGGTVTISYDRAANSTNIIFQAADVTENLTLTNLSLNASDFVFSGGLADGSGLIFASDKASALYWGKNERSGEWALDSSKWAYEDGRDASVPFTNGMDAHFTEAGGGGTITIQGTIEAQKLVVKGRTPYTFVLGSGSLTVKDSVNVGGGASATFNMDLYAPAAILDEGGMLTMGKDATFTGDTLSMKQQSILNGPGVFAPGKLILDVVDEGDKPKQPVVKGGAVLDTPIIEGIGVLHVKGATLRASQDTEVSKVELQVDEVSKATSRLEIQKDVTMNVGTMALEDAVVANNGKLHASALIVQSEEEVGMGVLTVDVLMQVDGATTVVMQEGSIGMLTLASENASLICENDLSLGSASSDQGKGNLEVGGALTVTGGVELGKVTAGSLTIGESESAALSVSGQLTAGSITLQHLSKSKPCLKADSLGAGTTSFEVDPGVLKSLDVGDGDTVVLADLKNPFADAASLTINGSGFWLNMEKRVLMSIGQDGESKDIVLSATAAQYIWTNGSENMLWGTDDNWMGRKVPDENAHALVLGAETPWTIIMDESGKVANLSFLVDSETTL